MGDAFARSFAAGDAKSVAAMFTEDAELIDETGERTARATGDRRVLHSDLSSEAAVDDRDCDRFAAVPEPRRRQGRRPHASQISRRAGRHSADTPFFMSRRMGGGSIPACAKSTRAGRASRASEVAGVARRASGSTRARIRRCTPVAAGHRTRTFCSAISRYTFRVSP